MSHTTCESPTARDQLIVVLTWAALQKWSSLRDLRLNIQWMHCNGQPLAEMAFCAPLIRTWLQTNVTPRLRTVELVVSGCLGGIALCVVNAIAHRQSSANNATADSHISYLKLECTPGSVYGHRLFSEALADALCSKIDHVSCVWDSAWSPNDQSDTAITAPSLFTLCRNLDPHLFSTSLDRHLIYGSNESQRCQRLTFTFPSIGHMPNGILTALTSYASLRQIEVRILGGANDCIPLGWQPWIPLDQIDEQMSFFATLDDRNVTDLTLDFGGVCMEADKFDCLWHNSLGYCPKLDSLCIIAPGAMVCDKDLDRCKILRPSRVRVIDVHLSERAGLSLVVARAWIERLRKEAVTHRKPEETTLAYRVRVSGAKRTREDVTEAEEEDKPVE